MLAIRLVTLIGIAVLCLSGLAGCLDVDRGALTIATTWTAAERDDFEKAFRETLPGGTRIRWVVLAPGDDVRHVVRRRVPYDMVLGGPASTYAGLAAEGRFEPDEDGGPSWRVVSTKAIGIVIPSTLSTHDQRPGWSFDDPRRDPVSLAWVEATLRHGTWPRSYRQLVRWAQQSRIVGRQTGATVAAFQRGEVGDAVTALSPQGASALGPRSVLLSSLKDHYHEGVAVVRGAPARIGGEIALIGLERRGHVGPPRQCGNVSEAGPMIADLMGATLVDSREELLAAHRAWVAAGQPPRPFEWMTEPPPWPPASVSKLLDREANARALLETLAEQIAPELDARAWLLKSWLERPRPIDGHLLDELAGAVDGRLAREPRFRAWLRGEWTAWARQRHRRVARQVAARKFPGAPS